MNVGQSEASFDLLEPAGQQRSKAPRLVQKLVQTLSATGDDFTVSLLCEVGGLLKRLRDELAGHLHDGAA